MRLFLLPISTRRSLLYCERLNITTKNEQSGSWIDKGKNKAAAIWVGWGEKEKGWKRWVSDNGNKSLQRIPFEEWGLKSVPPLSARRQEDEAKENRRIEVSFPSSIIPEEKVLDVLRTLSTERVGLHKQRLIYSIVGMPLVAPLAIVPVIPNLPFFYLVFRAWSHWTALSGSKHIQFLLDKKLLKPEASPILDKLYARNKNPFATPAKSSGPTEERILLTEDEGKDIALVLDIPELFLELKRAVWQVERSLASQQKEAAVVQEQEVDAVRKEKGIDAANEEKKDR
ncbi:fungal and plant [Calycina marina]|uniref:Fungal and plant n=1 Tax=Calycina marina TaxID=1763456 RepID=A0A9P8CDA6_9HELO|nr:fungal and plant [Calycina marina]